MAGTSNSLHHIYGIRDIDVQDTKHKLTCYLKDNLKVKTTLQFIRLNLELVFE